ncbi:hypothetical protein GGR55DRAFT_664974 [Xylaria sp. FL0064]|nr:hypothetical protein GGR55DRAFT_664974 [Xylaria sp. FL0064]
MLGSAQFDILNLTLLCHLINTLFTSVDLDETGSRSTTEVVYSTTFTQDHHSLPDLDADIPNTKPDGTPDNLTIPIDPVIRAYFM